MAEDKKINESGEVVKSGAEVKVAKRATKAAEEATSAVRQSGVKTSGVKG